MGFALALALAPFGRGSYFINNQPVSGPTFFREAWPSYLLAVGLHAVIAFGLWRERPWVRWLLLAYWPAFGILLAVFYLRHPEAVPDVVGTALFSVLASVVAWWYLYRRQNVVTYFRALEQRARGERGVR